MVRREMPGRWVSWCIGGSRSDRNRRGTRRFVALSQPAQIGWMEGQEFVTTSASLKDVSLSGLSAQAGVALPVATTVWVSLKDHPAGRWVKAVVVEVKRVRRLLTCGRSEYLIRMRYGLGCPYTFFRAAIGGSEMLVPREAFGESSA